MNLLAIIIYFVMILGWMSIKNIPPHFVLLSSAVLFSIIGWIPWLNWINVLFNPSLQTIFFLVLMSGVIKRQPWIYRIQMRAGSSLHPSILISLIMGLSMFINNIPIVMILLPMIHEKVKTSHQKWWIALSYASIFGGMLTLIGTSTNLLVNAWLIEQQHPPLGFFETGLFAFPIVLIATLILLKDVSSTSKVSKNEVYPELQDHLVGFEITQDSSLHQISLKDASVNYLNGSYCTLIVRDGMTLFPLNENTILLSGDHLYFGGNIDLFKHLFQFQGLRLIETKENYKKVHLVEALTLNNFHQSIGALKLKEQLNGIIIGIIRGGRPLVQSYKDVTLLEKDIVLIVMNAKDDLDHPSFQQVSRHAVMESISIKNTIVSIMFLGAILLGMFKIVDYSISLPILIVFSLINHDISLKGIIHETQPKLMLALYSGLVLAQVFQTPIIREELYFYLSAWLMTIPMWMFVIVIALLTILFTEVMNNGVAAMMMLSLVSLLYEVVRFDFRTIILMVTILASASFMNILGYQTHLIVMNAGRLKSLDFIQRGWKYSLCFVVGTVVLVLLRMM
jgi:Na+/H+ antiporter NhaD/arsenite permease-like protein/Trk K+ transport system NAD-binding subunit